jgi:hypothetical protein
MLQSLTPEQEARFFASLKLSNGTFKTIYEHRMDDLNDFIIDRWKEECFRPLEVMDVGASSGIATVEWLASLRAVGFDVHMTATDIAISALLVQLRPWFAVLITQQSHILQHIVFGLTIRPWSRRLDYLTGYILLSQLANRLAVRWLAKHDWQQDARRVQLLSQRALMKDDIMWENDDVLAANPALFIGRFDAIRAANILNPEYFGSAEIRRAVLNLKVRLRGPGSFLIVNKTHKDGSNHATLFRLDERSDFRVHSKFGYGSEIDDIVTTS